MKMSRPALTYPNVVASLGSLKAIDFAAGQLPAGAAGRRVLWRRVLQLLGRDHPVRVSIDRILNA
jgi:hypothetical protein